VSKQQRVAEAAKPRPVPEEPRPVPKVTRLEGRILLPDLRGLTVAEVEAVSKQARLTVNISGRGRAVSQTPPPGTVLAAGAGDVWVLCEPGTDPI
jgi:beta-lactam-binding protein with PASTA domain